MSKQKIWGAGGILSETGAKWIEMSDAIGNVLYGVPNQLWPMPIFAWASGFWTSVSVPTPSCLGPMPANPWFSNPRAAAIAQLGEVPPDDPNAPGPMAFHDTDRDLSLFRQAGLTDAKAKAVNVPLCPPGDAGKVARMISSIGPASRIMREKAGRPENAQAITDRVAVALRAFVTPQGIKVPTRLNFYSATVS